MSEVKRQIVEEIHRPARKNFKRRKMILKGIYDLWQADLIEMIPYSKENKGFKYILVVIDCFSKYIWAVAVKRKSGNDINDAFRKILQSCKGRVPRNLQTDRGKEFYNKGANSLFKKFCINHYSTYSNTKASIVERAIRTLKNMFWKKFSLQGTYEWISLLKSLLQEYNNKKHRTIGMAPAEVKYGEIETHLLENVFASKDDKCIKKNKIKFKTGDHVRISKFKAQFSKGYTPNWSAEIFKVCKVKKTNPVTYILKDSSEQEISGGFYQEELQLVKYPDAYLVEKVIKKNKRNALVKWLGFDSTHNSWVDIKHLKI